MEKQAVRPKKIAMRGERKHDRTGMNQHLLVVDDEPPLRALLKLYFERNGFVVSVAESAAAAFARAAEARPDVVLLDLLLPDGDGLGTLEKLRAEHPGLPVIIITGMGMDEELLQEALASGAAGYVSKTLPLEQLMKEVRRALEDKGQ